MSVELHKELFFDLTLTNPSSSLAIFKVKTTARDRYLLKPTQDYIPPHSTKICKIVCTKFDSYPVVDNSSTSKDSSSANKNTNKDKFLVQSTNIDREVQDLTKVVSLIKKTISVA